MVQQPMRARSYCAHSSIRDHWALRCMSRCLVQDVLEQSVKGHHTSPTNLSELWTALANIWQVIPVERFKKLVGAMTYRVAAVIKLTAVAEWPWLQTRQIAGSKPNAVKDLHVDRLMHLKSMLSSPVSWCEHSERVVPVQVSSSSIDRGSKLRYPSPISFMLLHVIKVSDYVQNRDFKKAPKWIIFTIFSVT
ncbi:hypothetical protein TNCV_3342391 [Trichonephila clavipes]|nr:hypothetical protein TNCV_3342391 [Trichonephila clavipes]